MDLNEKQEMFLKLHFNAVEFPHTENIPEVLKNVFFQDLEVEADFFMRKIIELFGYEMLEKAYAAAQNWADFYSSQLFNFKRLTGDLDERPMVDNPDYYTENSVYFRVKKELGTPSPSEVASAAIKKARDN